MTTMTKPSYFRSLLHERRSTLIVAALVVFAAVSPTFLSPFGLNLFILTCISVIAVLGLDLLMGLADMQSLGQAAFYGLAAYAIGIATVRLDSSWLIGALVAVGITLLAAALFGVFVVRVTGLYFLLITLAIGQLLWGAAQRWGEITGGDNGLSGVPLPMRELRDSTAFAYFALLVCVLAFGVAWMVARSPLGLVVRGARDNQVKAQSLGIWVSVARWVLYVIAGVMAGIAGILGASYNAFVSPGDLHLQSSFNFMLMVIIGGAGYLYGGIIGAFIVNLLQYGLSTLLPDSWMLIMGVLFAAVALFLPSGALGNRQVQRWVRLQQKSLVKSSGAVAQNESEPTDPLATDPHPVAESRGDTENPVVEVSGVSQQFGGFHALKNVSFSVESGERVAVIGPNGAGKSTLFSVIGGQDRPRSGAVRVRGVELTRRGPAERIRRGVARTFQLGQVMSSLTVRDNVALAILASERSLLKQIRFWRPVPRAVGDAADQILAKLGMLGEVDRAASELSYGHQKQLELGMALASNPEVLLLDEPMAGLSQSEAAQMAEIIVALPKSVSLVIVEHNLDVVFTVTDRLIVLNHGEVVADGAQEDVRKSDEVREIYFGRHA